MGQGILTLSFLSLLCAGCATGARQLLSLRPVKSANQKDFDYFVFVRQWPGSYCSKHACPLLHNRGFHFTIHGLWPNYDDGSYPQFCDSDYEFDEDKLSDLLDDLEDEWPSFMGADEGFWDHEWSKHGTCSLSVLRSERQYFKTILKLHRRYNLEDALLDADIEPSRDTVYKARELADAIDDKYGVRAAVHCYGKELSEIWMCFDRDLRPFDCDPSHIADSCSELVIPPLLRLDAAASTATATAKAARQQGNGLAASGTTTDAAGGAASEGAAAGTAASVASVGGAVDGTH